MIGKNYPTHLALGGNFLFKIPLWLEGHFTLERPYLSTIRGEQL